MGVTWHNHCVCHGIRSTNIWVHIILKQQNYQKKNFDFIIIFNSNATTAYNKVLLANAATSALRLHQRLPRISLTREFLAQLLVEDSCHYLFFSLTFLYVQPMVLILFPVVLFAVLHSASYSLTLLDVSIWCFAIARS